MARAVPSSTPGHHHIDVELPWRRYVILAGFTLAGLVGPSYFVHSLRRRMALVRPPEARKVEQPEQPAPPGQLEMVS